MIIPKHDPHYRAIAAFYGDQRAKRSGVRYMNHIDEGLLVLDAIDATQDAQRAYCLHPIVQANVDLDRAFDKDSVLVTYPVLVDVISLAIEYRCVANAYLSTREIGNRVTAIQLSTRPEVNQMLIADKVQNRKDFLQYHASTHPRSKALQNYFDNWLTRLGITEDVLQGLTEVCRSE